MVQSWKDCVGVSPPGVRISPAPILKQGRARVLGVNGRGSQGENKAPLVGLKSKKSTPTVTQVLPSPVSGFLTIQQVMEVTGKSRKTILEWCRNGRLAAIPQTYGSKVTFKVSPHALAALNSEVLPSALQTSRKAQSSQANKPLQENHRPYVLLWLEAMRRGVLTGKPYSSLTIADYHKQVQDFFIAHPSVSLQSVRQELMKLPASAYPRRFKLYKAIVCFAKFLIQNDALSPQFLIDLKPHAPKRAKSPTRQTVVWEDIQSMLAAATNLQNKALLTLLTHTGLRASEACSLTLKDLNLEQQHLQVVKGKGGKSRPVGLNTATKQALQEWIKAHPAPHSLDSPLFLNKDNSGPLTRHGLHRRITYIASKVGVQAHPHALRRAFVTLNANKGRPLVILQRSCGHSSIKTTMGYCMTSEQEVIEEMQRWD